jgi:hypothetical protein
MAGAIKLVGARPELAKQDQEVLNETSNMVLQ